MVELNYIASLLALLVYFPILFLGFISKRFKGLFMKVHSSTKTDYAVEAIAGVNYTFMILLFLIFEFTSSISLFVVGVLVYIVSVAVTFTGYYRFYYSKKHILLMNFPFNISRNPTYIFGLLALLGVAVMTMSVIHATLIFLQLVLTHHIIRNEEAYCEEKFGKGYEKYKAKVRRYL